MDRAQIIDLLNEEISRLEQVRALLSETGTGAAKVGTSASAQTKRAARTPQATKGAVAGAKPRRQVSEAGKANMAKAQQARRAQQKVASKKAASKKAASKKVASRPRIDRAAAKTTVKAAKKAAAKRPAKKSVGRGVPRKTSTATKTSAE